MQSSCLGLIEGLGWTSGGNNKDTVVDIRIARALFGSHLPWRDYDRAITALVPQTPHITTIKRERTDDESQNIVKRANVGGGSGSNAFVDSKQGIRILERSEMPEQQIKSESSRRIDEHTSTTTISDVNAADVREQMQRGLGDATQSYRARVLTHFAADSRMLASDIHKISRTLLVMLLEPLVFSIASLVQRPDADLEQREAARLLSGAPPTIDDQRAMNKHIVSLTFNVFSGVHEFALDMTSLQSASIVEALYFFVVFGSIMFESDERSSTVHRLFNFRYNSHLERLVDRGAFIGRTCCALVRAEERCYAATLRQRLLLGLDAAMTELNTMRSSANRNLRNLDALQRAKAMLLAP
jgi:hypothetical protein